MISHLKSDQREVFLVVASFQDSILNFRKDLLISIQNLGFSLHLACPGLSPESKEGLKLQALGMYVHDIPMERTGTNPINDFYTFLALYNLTRKLKPAAILCYTIKPVIYGMIAAGLARVKKRYALITGLGYTFQAPKSIWLARITRAMYFAALYFSTKVFFQNSDDEYLFRSSGILPKNKSSVVVNGSGINLGRFPKTILPEGRTTFLLIARLLHAKGIGEYVSAARLLKNDYPSVRFLLVGWIDENPDAISETDLESWVQEGTIEFLGHMQDVRQAIARCHVYVLPSYREGTPRTVLEAMAMGRAIITTDAPGCRETVVNGENGFLVPVKDVNALCEAMKKFAGDESLQETMGARSRIIAERKFDVDSINEIMLREMLLR